MKNLLARWLPRHRRARAAPGPLHLRLTQVPPNTPPGAPIYLAGTCNGWTSDHPDYSFTPPDPLDGSRRLVLPPGWPHPLEFKLTRGSWGNAEAGPAGEARPNRRLAHASAGEVELQVLGWQDGGQLPSARHHTVTTGVRVLALDFLVPQLKRMRRVWVYLPPDYDQQPARRYPVLYVQDGQNAFDEVPAYAGEWGIDETLDQRYHADPARGGCLVVAVANGGNYRLDEYSAWPNARLRRGGQGAQYVDFLADTLKPYVDQHYRTRPDAASTGILGSSMGGLLALYAGLRRPEVFGRVGVFSPALWFARAELLAYLAQHPPRPNARYYLLGGADEYPGLGPLMREAAAALQAGGLPPDRLVCELRAGGQHAEWFWRQEFGAAYDWLYQ